MGGYKVFGIGASVSKRYSGLPGHTSVNIQWDAYIIDSWDGGSSTDDYEVTVDGDQKYYFKYNMDDYSKTSYCGNSDYSDYTYTASITFEHNSTDLLLAFNSGLDEYPDNEAFGFKNLKITVYVICAPECKTCFGNSNTECYTCNSDYYLWGNTCVSSCPARTYSSDKVCKGKFSSLYFLFMILFFFRLR